MPLISSQPQYSMLWRVIEAEVIPACKLAGLGQIVWSPIAQGVLTGKYQPGQTAPEGSRATDPTGSGFIGRWLNDAVLTPASAFPVPSMASPAGVARRSARPPRS